MGLEPKAEAGHHAATRTRKRLARAIDQRWERPGRALRRFRAPAAAVVLSLLVFLSPELTLAPLSAVEPQRAGPAPIDRLDVFAPPRVQLVDLAVRVDPTAFPAPDPGKPAFMADLGNWNY